MAKLVFSKMVGAGNDFVVIDNRRGTVKKSPAVLARILSDRRNSIGADGVLLLEKSKKADIRMRIINSDGSEAEMCGNGIRCIAKFSADHRITGKKFSIETLAGIISAEVKGDIIKARITDPKDMKLNFRIPVNGREETLHFIDTGVPHTIKIVDSVDGIDMVNLGRTIRRHPHFAPRGTNFNAISIKGNEIWTRTYERGVEDETMACGTGSTAAALIAAAFKGLKSPVTAHTKGGEKLKIYFSKNGNAFKDVYLEGPVQQAFEGSVQI